MNSQTQKERLDRAIRTYQDAITTDKELNTPAKKRDYAEQILKMPDFSNINPRDDMKADMNKLSGKKPLNPQTTTEEYVGTIINKKTKERKGLTKDGKWVTIQ